MNKVELTGNLVKEPKLQQTPEGTKVISNTIAVKRDRKNKNGEYETDFINFVCWDSQAEYLSMYAKKGDRLELIGWWKTREYDDGTYKRIINELIVESLNVYSIREKEAPTYKEAVKNAIDKNELPF